MMNCYAVLKTNVSRSLEKTGKNLKYIYLSERSQSEEATYCVAYYRAHWERKNYSEVGR